MIESYVDTVSSEGKEENSDWVSEHSATPAEKKGMSKSMHDGVAVWCDCCSCEAEPYWVAIADEMGVDLGSDYEDLNLNSRDI